MLKYSVTIFICILLTTTSYATHNRAGEITFRYISGFQYEVTVTTYTYQLSTANNQRDILPIYWGDGSSGTIPRIEIDDKLDNFYQKNTYRTKHTYAGPGIYEILMEDPNRNLGVNNIPNSVVTVFSIKTKIVIGAGSGENSAPELLNPPIDKAAKGHVFIHNPGAYDTDGDSLSYQLTKCTGNDGYEIDGYFLPAATDTLYIDPVSGNLIWDAPVNTGVFNIAMFVDEWRNGIRISRIARDMQIDVYQTNNNAPINYGLKDFCVLAGDSISLHVTAVDPDGDAVKMEMYGGPFNGETPFSYDSTVGNTAYGTFTWKTDCDDARKLPVTILLKSEDIIANDTIKSDSLPEVNLVSISEFYITIQHHGPEGVELNPGVDSVQVKWQPSDCGTPEGYYIYRKIGSSGYSPDSCEVGVPEYTGFEKIGTTYNPFDTVFNDNNNGLGLVPGYDYCYRVTAYYKDGAESQTSEEACTTLISGIPAILKVSVLQHDEINGKIELAWKRPDGIDTIFPGQYKYEINRRGADEEGFSVVTSFLSPDLNDTVFVNENINTLQFPYYYNVRLYYGAEGNWTLIPGSETASSTYLDLFPEDNTLTVSTLKRAPWLNKGFTIYRQTEDEVDFDSVYFDSVNVYIDSNLINDKKYSYKVVTKSIRPIEGVDFISNNESHINTGIPIDTVAPCAPFLQVASICEDSYNSLVWSLDDALCKDADIVKYYVYYKEEEGMVLSKLDTLFDINQRTYDHYPTGRLAGCYALTAVDSVGNESVVNELCVDSCTYYYLPNVFTPNNDDVGNFYIAHNLGGFVKQVDMRIFNRYGSLVFQTNDPYIRWNGRGTESKELVPAGVYYYVCDVHEPRINGTELVTLTGFIHVFSGTNNPTTISE